MIEKLSTTTKHDADWEAYNTLKDALQIRTIMKSQAGSLTAFGQERNKRLQDDMIPAT